ncbi:TPA: hypothetical protein ACMVTQ_002159 [Clostridioides difficile]|uniref:hypothetical protein n=1 Tax=Clostridioides difficile TaxID=1496 RepID=UPI00038D418B|nr:hypothetical protein [Clostridioides difficile]EQG78631.1 putative phage protein [Clostridioides difficile DA00165]EAA0008340.1 hypothetical protein [Clostridioides difficile]EGT3639282.1 hypothetical protein [Clostridioides difficile]EGT3777046.1 hypothetical protein [Clostridioides difficile]EGT3817945.1 hypothetical protein [Clostridioides difficile]
MEYKEYEDLKNRVESYEDLQGSAEFAGRVIENLEDIDCPIRIGFKFPSKEDYKNIELDIATKDSNSIFIRTELAKAFKEILSKYEMDMENI